MVAKTSTNQYINVVLLVNLCSLLIL